MNSVGKFSASFSYRINFVFFLAWVGEIFGEIPYASTNGGENKEVGIVCISKHR